VAARLPKNVPDSGPGQAAGCCRSGNPDGPRRDGGRVAGAAPVAYRYRDGGDDEVAILTPTLVASDAGLSHLMRWGQTRSSNKAGTHGDRDRVASVTSRPRDPQPREHQVAGGNADDSRCLARMSSRIRIQ
jgi:hypothetical protein